MVRWWPGALLFVALLIVGGCASTPVAERPAPDAGAQPTLAPINRDLSDIETLWHLRAALNVAALSCASRSGDAVVRDYNSLLSQRKSQLMAAYQAKVAAYKSKAGGGWQRALDNHMTQLYNHFAWPPAQAEFCRVSAEVVKGALAQPPDALTGYAALSLPRIDAPILATQPGAPRLAARSAAPAARVSAPSATMATAPSAGPPARLGALPADWRIQVGAYTGQATASAAWALLKARSAALALYVPHYEPVPGRPGLVRLQLAGVKDRADAVVLCAQAAAAGFDCIPVSRGRSADG